MTSNAALARIAIDTIIFATDFSASSDHALPCAIAVAKRCQARLILTHVVTTPAPLASEDDAEARLSLQAGGSQSRMANNLAGIYASGMFKGIECEAVVSSGEVWNGISRMVKERDAKLVVLGTRALNGVRKLRQGSTAEDVMRAIDCPVLIVGPVAATRPASRFARILFATNFAKASRNALHSSLALAGNDLERLTALHVMPVMSAGKDPGRVKRQFTRKLLDTVWAECDLGSRLKTAVEFGRPDEEILRRAEVEQSDLIVLGAHAAGRLATFLPSTVHHILTHARCPVLASSAG